MASVDEGFALSMTSKLTQGVHGARIPCRRRCRRCESEDNKVVRARMEEEGKSLRARAHCRDRAPTTNYRGEPWLGPCNVRRAETE